MKGSGPKAIIRGTKTGRGKRLPVPEALADWVDHHVAKDGRLRGAPLFVNPRTGRRWSHWALRDRWIEAGKSVGVEGVRLYEGAKHTMATDAVRRGVNECALQALLGHRDATPTGDLLSRTRPADRCSGLFFPSVYLQLQAQIAWERFRRSAGTQGPRSIPISETDPASG
jgi:integrase